MKGETLIRLESLQKIVFHSLANLAKSISIQQIKKELADVIIYCQDLLD